MPVIDYLEQSRGVSMKLFKKEGADIGIDLGTANVLIYRQSEGIILNQPSIVAVDKLTKKVIAVGEEAYSMIGRTNNNIELIRPLKDGVIADFDVTCEMIKIFLNKVDSRNLIKLNQPKILICCPTNITSVERDAIAKVAELAGASEVFIQEEPKVAAVGAGLSIFEPLGNMVIDIGGGTTDIAVLSMGEIVNSSSLKVAGDLLTQDINDYVKNKYQLLIGTRMSERVKIELATALNPDENHKMTITGRDLVQGLPKKIEISEVDVYEALKVNIDRIVNETKSVLETTEPELSSDIIEQGIFLTGGGALLSGLDTYIEQCIGVPVYVAEDPLNAVVKGTGTLLELNADPNSPVRLA